MSYDDPTHWLGRAKEVRALAERMGEGVSKQMMRRIAEDYERLARTAEQRAKRLPLNPVSKTAVVPAEARPVAPRKNRVGALPARTPYLEIPAFLRPRPATG